MIRVNLLSTGPGAAAPAREWFPKEQRAAAMGLVMLLTTAAGVGGWWWYLKIETGSAETRIDQAQTRLEQLKETVKLVDTASARKSELAERLGLIERLRDAKRAPVSLLETVSRSIPEGLWLIGIKQTGAATTVEGRAMSLTSVTDFAEMLQSSGLFKMPVEILTTTTEVFEEQDVVRFSVKATALKPVVPASPSGPTPAAPGAPAAPAAKSGV